jgi:hypothetical protein
MGRTIRGWKGKSKDRLQSKEWHPRGGLIPATKHFSSVKDYRRKRDRNLEPFSDEEDYNDRAD